MLLARYIDTPITIMLYNILVYYVSTASFSYISSLSDNTMTGRTNLCDLFPDTLKACLAGSV